MRKIIAFYSGPFAGTDSCAAFVVDDHLTDDQIISWLEPWDEHDQWSEEFEEGTSTLKITTPICSALAVG